MNGHIDLLDLPHSEARRLLRTGAPVYLTVNPVEYHGPHLSLHNDRLVSLGLVHALHQRLAARHPEWPLLLAHDLEVGVDPCFGPGSRHGSYAQTSALVRESCRALAELGAERVVIMTFHGAPLHNLAIEDGIQLLARRGVPAVAPFNLVLAELTNPRLDPRRFAQAFAHIEDARERDAMIRGLAFDFHAGFFETSMALHYAPESVAPDHVRLPPCASFTPDRLTRAAGLLARALGRDALASELDFAASGLGWFRLSPFPGYTGRPHRATREAGAIFARFILDQLEPAVESALLGRAQSPPPIMRWLRLASLGGRIGGARLRPDQMPDQMPAADS